MYEILHDIKIQGKADQLYSLIATSEGLDEWWTTKAEGLAKEGETFRFYFNEQYDWYARVEQVSEKNHIYYRMIAANSGWKDTLLKFILIPQEKGHCLLRLEHSDWKDNKADFRGTSYFWAKYLTKIKELTEGKASTSSC